MVDELWLDQHGEERLREWLLRSNPTLEQRAFVRSVLEGVATRQPPDSLGEVRRDLASREVAITDPTDGTITVVVLPWGDEAQTYSLTFIGNLDDL